VQGIEMSGYDVRLERLELKYLVDEATAARIRRDIAPYCRADRHALEPVPGRHERGYAISSLYLDSPGLAFHRAKARGDAERLKLRVRTYGEASPAVLEIKLRSSDVIDKRRASVPREVVDRLVQGAPFAYVADEETKRFVDHFAGLAALYGAEPSLRIRYWREAYVSEVDDYARVTFDRAIEAQRATDWSLDEEGHGWLSFDHHWKPEQRAANVVLELKCHSAVPFWITELVRAHRLRRCSFSKYSIGIDLTGREMGASELLRRSARVMS